MNSMSVCAAAMLCALAVALPRVGEAKRKRFVTPTRRRPVTGLSPDRHGQDGAVFRPRPSFLS